MWEKISNPETEAGTLESHRLQVPGGWIVRTIISRHNAGAGVSQTFVTDSMHAWQLPKMETPS
jgi:hypothetical protein